MSVLGDQSIAGWVCASSLMRAMTRMDLRGWINSRLKAFFL